MSSDNSDENEIKISGELPGEWTVKKLLGPTLSEMGKDLKDVYTIGKNKIISSAAKKSDLDDGKVANLRVARDVFWNGSFTQESICAEYFGGVLASSRSKDGIDDSGVHYTDIIKSLSSTQLHLHYVIYHALNKLWTEMESDESKPNVGMGTELHKHSIWFATKELESFGISIERDLIALHSKGLVGNYEAKAHDLEDGKQLPYTKVAPTTLGVQLYAEAHNESEQWRDLPYRDFGSFEDIPVPEHASFSLDKMLSDIK